MKERTISAIIMVLIIVPILYFGGYLFDVAIGLLAVLAFYELMSVNKKKYIPNFMKILGIICMLALMYINVEGHTFIFGLSYETLSLVFLLLLTPTIFLKDRGYKVDNGFYLASIVIFLGTVFNLFIALYNESIKLFIFVILIACITDIFALLGGRLIGKHKLTSISPKKTIEGSVVGTIVATIIGTTYYTTVLSSHANFNSILLMVFIVMFLSIMGQLGDLFFSLIKRENDVKDYSKLIPGHGGILDRIDSLIFIIIAFVFIMQFI